MVLATAASFGVCGLPASLGCFWGFGVRSCVWGASGLDVWVVGGSATATGGNVGGVSDGDGDGEMVVVAAMTVRWYVVG